LPRVDPDQVLQDMQDVFGKADLVDKAAVVVGNCYFHTDLVGIHSMIHCHMAVDHIVVDLDIDTGWGHRMVDPVVMDTSHIPAVELLDLDSHMMDIEMDLVRNCYNLEVDIAVPEDLVVGNYMDMPCCNQSIY